MGEPRPYIVKTYRYFKCGNCKDGVVRYMRKTCLYAVSMRVLRCTHWKCRKTFLVEELEGLEEITDPDTKPQPDQ